MTADRTKPGPKAVPFWDRVDIRGADDCWPWIGKSFDRRGYGQLKVDMKSVRAHVRAWELTHSTNRAEGMVVMHSCDNPPCCNPAHLSLGTVQQNNEDKRLKGRQTKGEAISTALLTELQVREIRAKRAAGDITLLQLATQYGVRKQTIHSIVHGRLWKHIDTPAR